MNDKGTCVLVVLIIIKIVSSLTERLSNEKTRLVIAKQKYQPKVLCFRLFFSIFAAEDMDEDVRLYLFRKLKEENCFWSYDVSKMDNISDEAVIEHVLLYLDIDDINRLFALFGYKKVKRVWLDRVAPLSERYRNLNVFYAWYYFGAKRPEIYIKSIETKHVNRVLTRS